MKYDYITIYTGQEGWVSKMDGAGQAGYRLVDSLSFDGNHLIIMECARDTEG